MNASPPSKYRPRPQAGFTLLELLVVLAILGLLAAIAAPQVFKYLTSARADAARLQIQNLGTTLDLYRLETGRYPTTSEGLVSLVQQPANANRWNGPYVKRRDMLLDPWGNAFSYRFPGQHSEYDLWSLGSDAAEGGEGEARDIGNW